MLRTMSAVKSRDKDRWEDLPEFLPDDALLSVDGLDVPVPSDAAYPDNAPPPGADDTDTPDVPSPCVINVPTDPQARVSWTQDLLMDVALGASGESICKAYGLTPDQLSTIKRHPAFANQLKKVREALDKDGLSFRMRAQMQAEALLRTSWELIHSPTTPASVKVELIKQTVRWAGLDGPAAPVAMASAAGFSVNILLNEEGRVAQAANEANAASAPRAPAPAHAVIDV